MSDADLLTQVRDGSDPAFRSLYERHYGVARNVACRLAIDTHHANDLVAEAFTRVLSAIRVGKGPSTAFRSYLLITLRNVAVEHHRRDRSLRFVDDLSFVDNQDQPDPVHCDGERALVRDAYRRLSDRWRQVLWLTEVEQRTPAEVARVLGVTVAGASSLAYRAREGLRQAYLVSHLAGVGSRECRDTLALLGGWTRDGLSRRDRARIETHLAGCHECLRLAHELCELNRSLPTVIRGR